MEACGDTVLTVRDLNARHPSWDEDGSNEAGFVLRGWMLHHALHVLNPEIIRHEGSMCCT